MDEHTYWTLPLSHNSTAREMCISIAVKLERSEEAFEMYYLDTHTGQRMFNQKNTTHTHLFTSTIPQHSIFCILWFVENNAYIHFLSQLQR